jgi:hypothetical protein
MNNLNAYTSVLFPFMDLYADMQKNNKEWEDRIKKEWKESKNYPRKKKKQVRKSLRLDWSICHSTDLIF